MATIDRRDRWYILFLNNMAASHARLAGLTSNPLARMSYLSTTARYIGELDAAVFSAMRRAA